MAATTRTIETQERSGAADAVMGVIRRNGWALSLVVFLGLLLVFTRFVQPTYGVTGVSGLAISILPLALAATAQAVIVISGGIDLSIGSMMALTSVVAAVAMKGQSGEVAVLVIIGVLVLGFALGAINGTLVVLTKVPDIIVTLAMAFVWAGPALLLLARPGGGAADWLKQIVKGNLSNDIVPQATFVLEWIPRAAIVLIVIIAVVWLPIQRSRLGLSMYAIGSNQLAAFRSGVNVGRTKILAYGIAGLFSAFGGLSLVASSGIASPVAGPYTLLSVAAIVLGGVSLAGGRGGVFGPVIAVIILTLIGVDMTFMNVNPNLATVAQGAILVGVVMLGTFLQYVRTRR
jgi:ribose transport system permease protein